MFVLIFVYLLLKYYWFGRNKFKVFLL